MSVFAIKVLNNLPHIVAEGEVESFDLDFLTGDFTPTARFSSEALSFGPTIGSTLFLTSPAGTKQLNVFGAPTNFVVNEWAAVQLDTGQWFWSIVVEVNNAGGTCILKDALPSQASSGSRAVSQTDMTGATDYSIIEDFKFNKYREIQGNTIRLKTAELKYGNTIFVPSDELVSEIGNYMTTGRPATEFSILDAEGREYTFKSSRDLADFTYTVMGYISSIHSGQDALVDSLWLDLNNQTAVDAIVDNRTPVQPALTGNYFGRLFTVDSKISMDGVSDNQFPFLGEYLAEFTGQTGDLATDFSLRGHSLYIQVNSITNGGQMTITGTSINPFTNAPTTGDTETLGIDNTTATYVTAKKWLEITNIDVSSGTITGINYDAGSLSTYTANKSDFRFLGWRGDFRSQGAGPDVGMRVRKFSIDQSTRLLTITLLEDIGLDSTASNGQLIDNLRTGAADRGYVFNSEAWDNNRQFTISQFDLNTYFEETDNVILGSKEQGILVDFLGAPGGGISNVDSVFISLVFDL